MSNLHKNNAAEWVMFAVVYPFGFGSQVAMGATVAACETMTNETVPKLDYAVPPVRSCGTSKKSQARVFVFAVNLARSGGVLHMLGLEIGRRCA